MSEICLIDDIDAAASHCTPLGRRILSDSIEPIRRAVAAAVAKHRWLVVSHAAFDEWITKLMLVADAPSFVIDPLLNIDARRGVRCRVSCRMNQNTKQHDIFQDGSSNCPIRYSKDTQGVSAQSQFKVARGKYCSSIQICVALRQMRMIVLWFALNKNWDTLRGYRIWPRWETRLESFRRV